MDPNVMLMTMAHAHSAALHQAAAHQQQQMLMPEERMQLLQQIQQQSQAQAVQAQAQAQAVLAAQQALSLQHNEGVENVLGPAYLQAAYRQHMQAQQQQQQQVPPQVLQLNGQAVLLQQQLQLLIQQCGGHPNEAQQAQILSLQNALQYIAQLAQQTLNGNNSNGPVLSIPSDDAANGQSCHQVS